VKWRFAFDANDVRAALEALGVRNGDTVLTHSAYSAFEAFTGRSPQEIVEVMTASVGSDGTLLMPTLPFRGSALQWVAGQAVFDVKRTPSKMGLLTEVFRQSAGVSRSVHPTHAVAAWGANAQAMIADHCAAGTPCGHPSPFSKLRDADAWILFAGTSIRAMTYYHSLEELLEPLMPRSPFTQQTFQMVSRDTSGNLVECSFRLFEPTLSSERDLTPLVPLLRARGQWQERRLGTLDLALVRVRDVTRIVMEHAERGSFFYRSLWKGNEPARGRTR
jgi:aminoglycoside 3-N-acetyltransferase